MVCPSVNKGLLPMKAHYFLFNAGASPIVPFLPTYAKQLGFSSLLVGTIYSVLPIFGMLSKPLFGGIADHFKQQKSLFLIFQLLSAVTLFSIQFIPEVPAESKLDLHCHQETNLVKCDPFDINSLVAVEASGNGTVLCHLQCSLNSSTAYQDLCSDWHLPQYCSNAVQNQTGEVISNIHNLPTVLEFTAEIHMQYFERVKNCAYFRVSNAKDADGKPHIPYCEKFQNLKNCKADCNSRQVMDVISEPPSDSGPLASHQFWALFILLIVSWSSMAVVGSVGDTICFGMLGDKPNHYGQQRLWGAVGWGLFSFIAGVLVDELSQGKVKKDYTVVFYLVLINIILSIVVSYRLKYSQTQISRNILRDVGLMLSEVRIVVFVIWCMIVGINTALLWQFLFWHLEDLGGNAVWMKALQGLISGVQCFGGELPFFFLSGWIIKRLGHIHVMTLVLLAFSARFFFYSILSNPWLCLPIELLQGVTFGLFYSTMASYASILSPPGTEATVQGLVGAVFEGIGVSLGSLIGGAFIHVYSGSVAFGIFSGISFLCAILHAAVQFILSRSSPLPNEEKGFKTVRYAPPTEMHDILDDHQILTAS